MNLDKHIKICHMTSVHSNRDDRIFMKECVSLAEAYDVYQVAVGDTDFLDNVHRIGVKECKGNRIRRMFKGTRDIYRTALKIDADIYHFHDPELLPYGLKLKNRGKKVIFDSHEDISGQILNKTWIPVLLRKLVSKIYYCYETYTVGHLDAVITATPYIGKQFINRTKRVVVINNYPKLDDVVFQDRSFSEREPIICYAGGISKLRGEEIMTDAMRGVNGKLVLAGNRQEHSSLEKTDANIIYLGQVTRERINELYKSAIAGFCILLPVKNYKNAQPIKLYEYMAAGLPFIATNFPSIVEISKKWECGICVPVDRPDEIKKAVLKLLNNRELAQKMGRNGRRAVEQEYNWTSEEEKLKELYKALL